MDEEMNNLKVLGIATGIIEYKDESVDEYNYLLVEDVKNKAKYYINMHSIEEMTDFEDLKDTILEIEPYRKEKELTHLPKGEVFIEGFSININILYQKKKIYLIHRNIAKCMIKYMMMQKKNLSITIFIHLIWK